MLKLKRKESLLLFFLLAILLHFSGLTGDIYIIDEARNAECAREMLERQDLIVPTYNYQLRTDKPPLHYYFMMVSYQLFGVSAFAARFFSALMGIGSLFLTFFMARRYLGESAAIWTAIVWLSALHLAVQFHMAVPDPYLIFFTTASLFAFFEHIQTGRRLPAYLMYGSMGLAVLAKGPIAIALPGLIMLLYLLGSRQLNWNTIRTLRPLEGALMVAGIALPWYLAVHYQTDGAWTRGFFLEHNLNRFANTKEGHGGTFLAAPLFALGGMLPGALFIGLALRHVRIASADSLLRFSLIAATAIIIFFMLSSTRLPNYTAPAYPFLALLIGNALAQRPSFSILRPYLIAAFVLALLLVPGAFIGLQLEPALQTKTGWALALTPAAIGAAMSLFRFKRYGLYALFAGFYLTAVGGNYTMYKQVGQANPVAQSLPDLKDAPEVFYFGDFNQAYPFYLEKELKPLKSKAAVKAFLQNHLNGIIITTTKKLQEDDYLPYGKKLLELKNVFEGDVTLIIQATDYNASL